MIISKKRENNLLTPEKAATFLPIFISSFISIFIIIFYAYPQFTESNKVNSELNELIKKKDDLENLRSQYKKINQKFLKLNKEKERLIELISGASNLETLLSKLGELAKKNNIKFISIIPKDIIPFIEKNLQQNQNAQQITSKIDPLLVEGTKKYLIEFSFKTDFFNLLSFIRELEFQESVILLDNINVNYINDNNTKNKLEPLQVKLIMTTYGKN
tara:strand:+ start:2439 stop:3086 length:648 start_codon:yes stop_codon:yes gene_type:complete